MAEKFIARWLLIAAGTVSAGLGVLGIFLPLLPATPLFLLAAACYVRSSEKLYARLINSRWPGCYIRSYRDGKGISLRVKVLFITLLWISIGYSAAFAVENLFVRIVLGLIAVCVTAHLLSIPTLPGETTKGSSAG